MNAWLVYVTEDEVLVLASRRNVDKNYYDELSAEASKFPPETAVKHYRLNL